MERRLCVLNENEYCTGCGECDRCDLDPNKICDNCMKCVLTGADYLAIEIDEVLTDESEIEEDPPLE